ncbi:unnamed protein product [Brassica oleracea]
MISFPSLSLITCFTSSPCLSQKSRRDAPIVHLQNLMHRDATTGSSRRLGAIMPCHRERASPSLVKRLTCCCLASNSRDVYMS